VYIATRRWQNHHKKQTENTEIQNAVNGYTIKEHGKKEKNVLQAIFVGDKQAAVH
jgi:hypothetical protein